MVKLNKIYTRTGDGGDTSLVNGMRVSKHARRPSAFGEVDEANSVIGLARLHCGTADDATMQEADAMLGRIQNDLFDLGADIATPETDQPALRITETQVQRLENEIDMMNADLQPLNSFILPGGSPASAWLHLARTVIRRADIATPETDQPALRITETQVQRLENEIDMMNADLQPLNSFILPGGSPASAWLHLARTVIRRAERHMTELSAEEVVNAPAMQYINRLSDHLFVLARRLNENGKTDVLWRPGQNSGQN